MHDKRTSLRYGMPHRDIHKVLCLCGYDGLKEKSCDSEKDLEESGFSQEIISGLHSPIGLAIGGQTPEEIALSVISEIVKCKNERTSCTQIDNEVLDALTEVLGIVHQLHTPRMRSTYCVPS